ncbi:MAG: SpoIID/LytB domain-containing protein [Erysipelotrichales bacterium]|nr:SpoIID/LytB domain-containing protein [Erysipelotrichales bacterium]
MKKIVLSIAFIFALIGLVGCEVTTTDPTIHLTYHLNGGNNHPSNRATLLPEELPFALFEPFRGSDFFLGWFDNPDFTGEAISEITEGMGRNIDLYARFGDRDSTLTITYHLNGGTFDRENDTILIRELPFILGTPERANFWFRGWYTNPDFTGSPLTIVPTQQRTNLNLFARWEDMPSEFGVFSGVIQSINLNTRTIFLENGVIEYTDSTRVLNYVDGEFIHRPINWLRSGLRNTVYFVSNPDTSELAFIVVNGYMTYENIRVRINRTTDLTGGVADHQNVTLRSSSPMRWRLANEHNFRAIPANVDFRAVHSPGGIRIYFNNVFQLFTPGRIHVESERDRIQVTTITRSQGIPAYHGSFEIAVSGQNLLLINEVALEDYLKSVVPSEMPASWNLEALKAQTVAARTYALGRFFQNPGADFHVEDSVQDQVYNNSNEFVSTNRAVAETAGVHIVDANRDTIMTFYSSASSGFTSHPDQVWFTGRFDPNRPLNPVFRSTGFSQVNGVQLEIDINDEASMLAFYQTIQMDTFDNSSPMHRWRYSPTFDQLTAQLNVTLRERRNARPQQVLTFDGTHFVQRPIPENIGTVTDLRVGRRGEGGVLISLIIETTEHTFLVYTEFNIRMLFRDITIMRASSTNTDWVNTFNITFLPSAFFAFQREGNVLHFFGGGFGHGAGMSQHGANGMAARGFGYRDIISFYFNNPTFLNNIPDATPLDHAWLVEQLRRG